MLANAKHGVCHYSILAAARIAAMLDAPLNFLNPSGIEQAVRTYLTNKAPTITNGIFVGNLNLIPQAIRNDFTDLID
jgi:hypothetical protein